MKFSMRIICSLELSLLLALSTHSKLLIGRKAADVLTPIPQVNSDTVPPRTDPPPKPQRLLAGLGVSSNFGLAAVVAVTAATATAAAAGCCCCKPSDELNEEGDGYELPTTEERTEKDDELEDVKVYGAESHGNTTDDGDVILEMEDVPVAGKRAESPPPSYPGTPAQAHVHL